MSESRSARSAPPVLRNRIREDDSRIVERAVILLIAFWFGGLLIVSLGAGGSFKAVETTLDKPPAVVTKAMARLGTDSTRDLLRYQSSEVNRHLFELWGWVQLALSSASLAALLFMSNAGKKLLGLAASMTALAGLMSGILIPGMIRVGREMQASPHGPSADMSRSFKNLHQAFGAFETVAAILALFLVAGLLRRSSRARI